MLPKTVIVINDLIILLPSFLYMTTIYIWEFEISPNSNKHLLTNRLSPLRRFVLPFSQSISL